MCDQTAQTQKLVLILESCTIALAWQILHDVERLPIRCRQESVARDSALHLLYNVIGRPIQVCLLVVSQPDARNSVS